jgi:hypothetical protein
MICFEGVIARASSGAVAIGRILDFNSHAINLKAIDISKKEEGLSQFENEVKIYAFEGLQGTIIPPLSYVESFVFHNDIRKENIMLDHTG